jgi:hypothetical protein
MWADGQLMKTKQTFKILLLFYHNLMSFFFLIQWIYYTVSADIRVEVCIYFVKKDECFNNIPRQIGWTD